MRRLLILGAVLAASIGTARAQLPPVTIEMLRGFAAAGMAPTNRDIEILSKCPALNWHFPADMTPQEFARARELRIDAGALWLRLNDAAIEKCLAGLSASERR